MARRVLNKVAQGYGGEVREKNVSFKTFDMKEAVIMRDAIGASTGGMVKMASMINAMRPELEADGYQLFPHCLAAKFALYESSNNLELVTEMFSLQVKKDDTLTRMLPFSYLKRPWELFALMVENSILDKSFEPSEGWMKAIYSGKIVFTYNLDKGGNDIVCSVRLLNRENGNSMKYTFPIAFVAGPVCECYENICVTILDKEKPVQQTLQGLAYDSYFMTTLIIDGEKKSQARSMMFCPTPAHAICENRFFDATLSDELIRMSDDFQFDLPQSTSGGPPEVEIPLDTEAILFKLVMSDKSSAASWRRKMVGESSLKRERANSMSRLARLTGNLSSTSLRRKLSESLSTTLRVSFATPSNICGIIVVNKISSSLFTQRLCPCMLRSKQNCKL